MNVQHSHEKNNQTKKLDLRITTITFIGVHFNHPWITASFFEQVIQQKTYTHKSDVFIYMFSVRILAIIERLKYGLNITIHEYGRKKV